MTENGSTNAIVELGRSRTRYKHQDQLLLGFMRQPDSTAKEIAAEVYDWKYEKYADAPKRAADLSSKHLGYLEQLSNRQCRRSGKDAHTYRITEKGVAYLRRKGLISNVDKVADKHERVSFDTLRQALHPDGSSPKPLHCG